MEIFIKDLYQIFTLPGVFILINIILIDIVMSGDNAIIIGMAVRKLDQKQRKKVIFFGIALATILRIVLASTAIFFMSITGIKIAGGILLFYVVWKFYKDLRSGNEEEKNEKEISPQSSLFQAIWLILIADFSMSLDNVLAVAGASKENVVAMGIGLIVSIALMAFASNFIAGKLEKHPQIQWFGLLVIFFVAMEMIMKGGEDISNKFNLSQITPIVIFFIGIIGVILHNKYIKPIEEQKIKNWLGQNYIFVIISNILILIFTVLLGDKIKEILFSHPVYLYSFFIIITFILIELISIYKFKKSKNNATS